MLLDRVLSARQSGGRQQSLSDRSAAHALCLRPVSKPLLGCCAGMEWEAASLLGGESQACS